MLVTAAH